MRAAIKLNCTVRHINRLIAGYKEYGKEFFVHGNRGRIPAHALSETQKTEIEQLYIHKYWDCTYTSFSEYLAERENIFISVDEVRVILRDKFIISPRTHKSTKNVLKNLLDPRLKKLKQKKKKANCKQTL